MILFSKNSIQIRKGLYIRYQLSEWSWSILIRVKIQRKGFISGRLMLQILSSGNTIHTMEELRDYLIYDSGIRIGNFYDPQPKEKNLAP